MTQSYCRPNYTTSNFSYDAWRLSGKPSCRKIPIKDDFAVAGKSPESSSILTKRHTDEPEKTYHPFIVVGSCNEIDNLSANTMLSNKYSISTHSVDRISKYREQISFSSSLSIRRKEFTSLDNGLQKRSTTGINLEKGANHGKTFSSSVKTKRYTTVQSHCAAQSNNSPTCETLKRENKSTSKLEINKFPVKRTSTPSHRKRISVKSFFSKKKNAASHNSVQDISEVGCSSWRSSTIKSPFSSPRKIPLAASREDIDCNNNNNKPSQSPRKKVYYSEKQSGDIDGVPSVPPTTPGRCNYHNSMYIVDRKSIN